jgi:DNA-directed RNA polymerase sigma subunit (sigma70/sigma32)
MEKPAIQSDANKFIYDQIKAQQITLSDDAQVALGIKLKAILEEIAYLSWENPATRILLCLEWQRRRTITAARSNTANVSKMARDYNSSIPGHNQKVRQRISDAFKAARQFSEAGRDDIGAHIFSKANVHPMFMITNKHHQILDKQTAEVHDLIAQLNRIQTTLVRGVMRLASELAHKKFHQLSGEIVDLSDLIQEALTSAYAGALIFDSDRDTKWSSFAWARMTSVMGKYAAEKSRTVPLPRTLLDQYLPVQRAIEELGVVDCNTLAIRANAINSEKKEKSTGRKLRAVEIISPEKVEEYLQQVTEWTSLDMTVNETSEDNREVPLTEILSTRRLDTEIWLEREMVYKKLVENLRGITTDEEWEILEVRWGLGADDVEALDYNRTLDVYKAKYPDRKLHRAKVKEIENRVLNRVNKEQFRAYLEALEELRVRGD